MCSWQHFFDCELTVFRESGGRAVYCSETTKDMSCKSLFHVRAAPPPIACWHMNTDVVLQSTCATNTGCDAAEHMNIESDDAGAWRAGRKEEGSE